MFRTALAALWLVAATPALAASPIGHTNMTFDPGHGTQIEYLSAKGGAYLWYPGNQIVLPGHWMKQGANLCFKYGPNTYNPVTHVYGDKWECEPTSLYTGHLVEQAAGDPFGLTQRTAVPFSLPRERESLQQVAARLGVSLTGATKSAPPAPPAALKATCASVIAGQGRSREATIDAALTLFHGEYMGKPCGKTDYVTAYRLLVQVDDKGDAQSILGDLRDRAKGGNPRAIAALEELHLGR